MNLQAEIINLVGTHIYDYTEWDTGIRKCRQDHGFGHWSASCHQAWLREQFPSLFGGNDESRI